MNLRLDFCPSDWRRHRASGWPFVRLALPDAAGGGRAAGLRVWRCLALLPVCLLLTSCPAVRKGHALGVLAPVSIPAEVVGRLFLVEATLEAHGRFRFLIDSGSTLSLVSPRVAAFARQEPGATVSTRTPDGDRVQLPRVTLPRLALGAATLVELPAGVHAFDDLSHQLGVRVDGVLGLPVFRDVLLTLDYPGGRLGLDPRGALERGAQNVRDAYYGAGVPLTAVRVGQRDVMALIDSGSDGALALDASVSVPLTAAPRHGGLRATLAGDRPSEISRAAADLRIGAQVVRRPIVEFTGGIPALGGDVLRNFSVCFDQRRSLIGFAGAAATVPEAPGRRSIGLSFVRAADHWRVVAVIPGTPAAESGIQVGDLCTAIDGEPVGAWPIDRLERELRARDRVTLAVRRDGGAREIGLPVVDLVR